MTSLIVAPVVTTSSTTTTPAPGGAPASARMDPARPARRAAPDLPDWERAPSARRTQSTALARRHAPREASAEATPAARGAVTGRERSLLLHEDGAGTTQISSQAGRSPSLWKRPASAAPRPSPHSARKGPRSRLGECFAARTRRRSAPS